MRPVNKGKLVFMNGLSQFRLPITRKIRIDSDATNLVPRLFSLILGARPPDPGEEDVTQLPETDTCLRSERRSSPCIFQVIASGSLSIRSNFVFQSSVKLKINLGE
jgi:hypothetical protein